MSPETGATWSGDWPRPPRLLDRPELIETVALLPDHPPVSFTWRGVRRRVKRADGPERLFGEWWKRDAELVAVRDYFRLEDDVGERFWIYRAGDGEDAATGSHRWFLHGVFGCPPLATPTYRSPPISTSCRPRADFRRMGESGVRAGRRARLFPGRG